MSSKSQQTPDKNRLVNNKTNLQAKSSKGTNR